MPRRDLYVDWSRTRYVTRRSTGFSPNVDVYYCGEPQRAVVKVDLAGVELSRGRDRGRRPPRWRSPARRHVQETEGRVYQQVEIPSGPVPAGDRAAGRGRRRAAPAPPTRTACCGSSCRCAIPRETTDSVPIGRKWEAPPDGGRPGSRGGRVAARRRGRDPRQPAAAGGAAGAAAARHGHLPGNADPAGGRPAALDPARRRRPRRQPDAGDGRLPRPRERGTGPGRPLRRRRRRRRRPHGQGPRRHPAHPRPGDAAGPARLLRRRAALPGRPDHRAARRDRAERRARGAEPQRPAHLLGDRRADPLPARGAAAWRSPTSTTRRRSAT